MITLHDTEVSPVPTDRSPMPPPNGIVARMLFTIQPGLAKPSNPVPICFPNSSKQFPGEQADLYFFNLAIADWDTWGTGTVTTDGSQVCSDPGFGLPSFAWHFPSGKPTEEECDCKEGDPVDLFSGQFVFDEVDFSLPGLMPIALTRHYASGESASRGFGVGTTHSYNWFLQGTVTQSPDFLVLVGPNGRQAPFRLDLTANAMVNRTEPWLAGAGITGGFGNPPFLLRFKDGTVWEFNLRGNLVAQRDRNGNQLTITREGDGFNDVGRVTEVKDDVSGRSLRFFYDSGNRITEIIDPIDRRVRYAYDGVGRLVTVTDPMGHVTRYTYDSAGRMETVTDKRGNVHVTNEYDAAGRVSKQTQADGGVWQFVYQVDGGLITKVTTTDPNGNVTQQRMNNAGFPLDRINALGQIIRQKRTIGTNLEESKTDSLGQTMFFTYDNAGNLVSVTSPDGNIVNFEFHPTFNGITKITRNLDGNTPLVNSFEYDVSGNLIANIDEAGSRSEFSYNSLGQIISAQSPIQSEPPSTLEYDASGNLVREIDPLGNILQFSYDSVGRQISAIDQRGFETRQRYDTLSRITEVADPRNGLTKFVYDSNGNTQSIIDPKMQKTTYSFDNMNRLTVRKDPLGREEFYEYDFKGNLTKLTDRKKQDSFFKYDGLDRVIEEAYSDGSSVKFFYDADGRLSKIIDSNDGETELSYNSLDRLIGKINSRGTAFYTYDILGRRETLTVNGNKPISYEYDPVGRLTKVVQGGIEVSLNYDPSSRLISSSYSNGTSASYSYDSAFRLKSISHQGQSGTIESLSYSYDSAGNRILHDRANGVATNLPNSAAATYDSANQLTQFNSETLINDQNGNLESDEVKTYVWDSRNRLIGITGPGFTASFSYDYQNRRVKKTVNGITTNYFYDGNNVIQEVIDGAVGVKYLRGFDLDQVFVRETSLPEFYHEDSLGSIQILTDQTGGVLTSYNYAPYGETSSTNSVENPFQFTARENDGTGLYFFRSRYYDPLRSRFISEDPLGLLAGLNSYNYADGNPINITDPLGLFSIPDPPRIPSPLGPSLFCIYRTGKQLDSFGFVDNAFDKFQHCAVGCLLEFICGKGSGWRAAWGKEILDIGGSGFSPLDIYATFVGVDCAKFVEEGCQPDCFRCCEKFFKKFK